MAELGRGCNTPPDTCRKMLQLYCERLTEDRFAYSVDEIAEMVDIDPKTCRKLIRDLTIPWIEQALIDKRI